MSILLVPEFVGLRTHLCTAALRARWLLTGSNKPYSVSKLSTGLASQLGIFLILFFSCGLNLSRTLLVLLFNLSFSSTQMYRVRYFDCLFQTSYKLLVLLSIVKSLFRSDYNPTHSVQSTHYLHRSVSNSSLFLPSSPDLSLSIVQSHLSSSHALPTSQTH